MKTVYKATAGNNASQRATDLANSTLKKMEYLKKHIYRRHRDLCKKIFRQKSLN